MRMKTVCAVSALALFAGVSTAAFAQAPGAGQQKEQRMQAPGQQIAPGQKQTAPGQQQREPGQRAAPGRQRGGEAQGPQRGQAQRGEGGAPERKEAVQPRDKQPQRAEQPDRERQKAEEPTRRERQRAEEPEGKDRQRAEEPERKDRQRAEQPERKDRERAEQPDRRREQAERPDRPRVSEQQRASVRERFRESGALDRARVAGVDFNISVGTRVPRERIRLAPLPTVIVEEIPAYRGYRYFVVRDQIVIVEPSTYVIVDVIRLDGAPGRAARADGRLTLSSEERQLVLSHIEPQAEVRLGIGDVSIGMSVPGTVELRPFPQAVIADVPELEEYRYFVFEQQVAIVDPDGRQVVLTISE